MCNRRRLTMLLLAAALSGCDEDTARWSGTMLDSSGVTIVSNTGIGLWSPREAWTLVEELRIGALDGPPELVFGEVGGVAVDSRGLIYVLDSQAQEVRTFTPEGAFQQSLGRRGEGPGEFQLAWAPVVGPGDTLLIPDGRLQRLNLYNPDGSFSRSSKWQIEQGRTMAFRSTTSGQIVEQLRPVWDPLAEPVDAGGVKDVLVLRSLNREVLDTLLTFPSGGLMGPGGVRAFAPEPKWDVEDGKLLFGRGDQFRISLYVDGRLERVITRPFQPEPVSDADRASVMREMERRWAEAQVPAEMLARLRTRWSFADSYPAYQDLAFGPAGTVWAQHVKVVSEFDDAELREWQNVRSSEWEVFDPKGRFLGVVVMPERFRFDEFRGDYAFGVAIGEQEEPYVARLRVVRSSPDATSESEGG